VIAELITEATTKINERVEEGRMTQEKADEMLANLEDNIMARLDGTFVRPEGDNAEGFGRGGRGRHGFGDDTPTDSTDDTTDSAEDTSDDT